jgi:hypothetical protein
VVVAVVFVGTVQPALDEVVGVIAMRNSLVSTPVAMSMRRITVGRISVVTRMCLIDCDYMLVDVLVVGVVQVPVM